MNFSKSEIKQLCFICDTPKYHVDSFLTNDSEVIGVCDTCQLYDYFEEVAVDMGLRRGEEISWVT